MQDNGQPPPDDLNSYLILYSAAQPHTTSIFIKNSQKITESHTPIKTIHHSLGPPASKNSTTSPTYLPSDSGDLPLPRRKRRTHLLLHPRSRPISPQFWHACSRGQTIRDIPSLRSQRARDVKEGGGWRLLR